MLQLDPARVRTALKIAVVVAMWTATASAAGHAVRIPSTAVDQLESISLQPRLVVDYGGFAWLVVDEGDLHRVAASGVPHSVIADAGVVRVPNHRFDPVAEGEPELPARLRALEGRTGLHLVQLVGPARDDWHRELAAAGLRILQYYPNNSFLVWADPAALDRSRSKAWVRWQGSFHPAYKINRELADRSGIIRNVEVLFVNDGRIHDTLEELVKFGAELISHAPAQPDRALHTAYLTLSADNIEDVARIPTVLWVGYQSPEPIFDDEKSDQIIAGNHVGGHPFVGYDAHLTGLGYDGSGVIWSINDSGVDYDHPDLGPRIVGGFTYPGCAAGDGPGDDLSSGGHGTHVAGIVGGDATGGFTDADGFLYGLGVAPSYSIFAQNPICGTQNSWPPAGGWQEISKNAVLGGAIGGNNSWTTGEGTQHGYQASERTHDIIVRDGNFDTTGVAEPYIEVFSAGNSGSSGLTAPKEAKNLIVTAASENDRFGGNIDDIASFSSRGPAVDGRWVPTITAPGDDIASTRNDLGGLCASPISGTNGLYSFCSGTSMAAPHTSGVIALATEWWRTFSGGADPSPAMAKALLVNSADDMGPADIPNVNEGWGRINLTTLIDPPAPREYWDQTDLFTDTGEQVVIAVGVPEPGQPLKVSLAWSDAPGAVGANPALVNDLDLTVDTGGSTYLGNVFSAGWSNTGGTADTINNLENVFVQNPGGSAIITIDATNIAGDAVFYNGDATDQDFALVCTNCDLQPDYTLEASPPVQTVCAPADATYDVSVGQILAYNDPVTLSQNGAPAGSTASFSINPVTPPGSSVLSIGNTGSAAPGSYDIEIGATSTSGDKSRTVQLDIFDSVPSAPALIAPADGTLDQPARPDFEWSAATQGGLYRIQVATDAAFTNVVLDVADIESTTYTPDSDLATNTEHYWRVASSNPCGTGPWSVAWSFVTLALPGDCGLGTTPTVHFFDDMESGAPGWTTSGSGVTWALGSGFGGPYSGAFVYHADDSTTVTDQRLVSPPVELPSGGFPITLQYWNNQSIEDSTSGCWDAGILEVSNDGGATWAQAQNVQLLTDPYDGTVNTSSNPLSGLEGWCGDPQPWIKSVVTLDDWAGQTVQFRFRLGTDTSVGHDGWDIDDVKVQSCLEEPTLDVFADGFESGDTSAWSDTVP